MNIRWLLIDGYSLLHRIEGRSAPRHPPATPGVALRAGRSGGLARDRLVRQLEELAGGLADRITVVFDGTGEKIDADPGRSAVEVVYSPGDKTADTVIERLVCEAPDPGGILVVTSDRAEREMVGASGAQSMACGDFPEFCDRHRRALASTAGSLRKKTPKPTLGDYFPER